MWELRYATGHAVIPAIRQVAHRGAIRPWRSYAMALAADGSTAIPVALCLTQEALLKGLEFVVV